MEPHKFKKPGGGRGRPSPSSLCAECGIIWTDHPKVTVVVKPKRVKKSVSARPRPRPVDCDTDVMPSEEDVEPDWSKTVDEPSLSVIRITKPSLTEEQIRDSKAKQQQLDDFAEQLREHWIKYQMEHHPEKGILDDRISKN